MDASTCGVFGLPGNTTGEFILIGDSSWSALNWLPIENEASPTIAINAATPKIYKTT